MPVFCKHLVILCVAASLIHGSLAAAVLGPPSASPSAAGKEERHNEAFARMLYSDDPVYIETRRICQSNPAMGGGVVGSTLYNQIIVDAFNEFRGAVSGDLDAANQVFQDSFNSRTYKTLITYPGFRLALKDCYPNNPRRQAYFIKRLWFAENLGRGAGVAGGVAQMGAYILGFELAMMIFPPLKSIFKWSGIGLGVLMGVQLLDALRWEFWGPITAKEKAAHEQMLKMLRDNMARGVEGIQQQDLALYDAIISELEGQLQKADPSSPRYFELKTKLNTLRSQRLEVLQRSNNIPLS